MATKNNMIQDMIYTSDIYKESLFEIGITETKFLKWIDSLTDYDKVRSGNKFIHGQFLKRLIIIKQVLGNHPSIAWIQLKIHSRNERLVVLLRDVTNDAKILWVKRPMFKVKKSQ